MTWLKTTALMITTGLSLAACVPETPGDDRPALPETANDSCGAHAAAHLIGKDAAAVSALANRRDPIRVISPGQPVTMDYLATRLNIELDAAGKIVRLNCG